MAAFVARAACVNARRPIRSDSVAAALRIASALSKATSAKWNFAEPKQRCGSGLRPLGWSGIGPAHSHDVFDAYADALQTRSPYVSNATAIAAVTLCSDSVSYCRLIRPDLTEYFGAASCDLLLLLSMALRHRPVANLDLNHLGASVDEPTKCEAKVGRAHVTVDFEAGMDAVVDLSLRTQPWVMSSKVFWALCAAVLCGDAEMAAQGEVVRLTHVEGPNPYRLQARGRDWRLNPSTLLQLQQALTQLLRDPRASRQVKRLELTEGVL